MQKVYIKTFGCQMNVHDSEQLLGLLAQEEYALAESISDADLVIVNTCSIRDKAYHKMESELGLLNHGKKNRPRLKFGVAGCAAPRARR